LRWLIPVPDHGLGRPCLTGHSVAKKSAFDRKVAGLARYEGPGRRTGFPVACVPMSSERDARPALNVPATDRSFPNSEPALQL